MNKNIIIGLLFAILIGACAFIFSLIQNDKEKDIAYAAEQTLLTQRYERAEEGERRAVDTATKYMNLAIQDEVKIDSLTQVTKEQEDEIGEISDLVANMVPSAAYDSLQKLLPPVNGDLDYCFDGNQTKQLYEDELKLEKLEPMYITCGETVDAQANEIMNLKKAVEFTTAAKDSCNIKADVALEKVGVAEERIDDLETDLKWWKRGTVGGVIAVVVFVLLL